MNDMTESIPLQVDIRRIIEVLSKQIYQSPLALLRENAQNAFDAILQRRHRGESFDPVINITIDTLLIIIEDNGFGMTKSELVNNFWQAGSSSKNTPDAKAAGVVGTFGIGAMANFGIAEEIIVVTESCITFERTMSIAKRDTLSVSKKCIEIHHEESRNSPGTRITAKIMPGNAVNIAEAVRYVEEFISFVDVTVCVNGTVISKKSLTDFLPDLPDAWENNEVTAQIGAHVTANVCLQVSKQGEIKILLSDLIYQGSDLSGIIALRQNANVIKTFRSGFGLSPMTFNSCYNFGGVVNLLVLEPTAGREALSTNSMQFLQGIINEIDAYVSFKLALRPESNSNTNFMDWVVKHNRFDLCANLKPNIVPSTIEFTLDQLRSSSSITPVLFYSGNDKDVIAAHASDDRFLLILSRTDPRRRCEVEYIRKYCSTEQVSDQPQVLSKKLAAHWSLAEFGFCTRLQSILENDYFLDAVIEFGKLSHGLPVWVDKSLAPAVIVIDPDGSTASIILRLYETEFSSFGSMVKDFMRNMIFPRISDLVPSSTSQGAEAFLRSIRRPKEIFEYEMSDLGSLSEIWGQFAEGAITFEDAAQRSLLLATTSIQTLDTTSAKQIKEVVPDLVYSEAIVTDQLSSDYSQLDPLPALDRLEVECDAKLLTINESDSAINGYRFFLALSDNARNERGDFFLQPHKTSVVWGGQKALFIFIHHSGRFGLYYDIQSADLISSESGGGPFTTCTLMLKNRIYIPIPPQIQSAFVPVNDTKKRFEVRFDILYTNT